jgi:triacylglycerol esterase/lipase EstA (alpha/beta hydrolase family)
MWTAISLWLVIGGGLAVYAAWAAVNVAQGASWLGYVLAAPLVYLAVPLFFTMQWFALAWIYRSPRPPERRLGFAATLRLVRDEFVAIAGSAFRMALYRWLVRDPAPAPAVLPVLLVHGVLCNAGVWLSVKRRLQARGIGPVYTLSYGPPLASIESFADQLATKVDAVLAATGARELVVVGHSMGGLVIRAYLRRHGGAKTRRAVTIGTPHHGSEHARTFFGTCLRELRPGSAWLAGLDADEATPPSVPLVSIWSWHDSMVAPQRSSVLAWAENVAVAGVGHNAMLRDRGVFDLVVAEITRTGART